MLDKLFRFSCSRLAWVSLLGFVIFFEACALFFQHVVMLAPCVMCIYERVAMLGIGGAAIIGLIAPSHPLGRLLGLLSWAYTAYRGLTLAMQHVDYQFHPSPFATCDVFVQFPQALPLNQWMPWMFEAYGDCSKVVWQFFSMSMPQWLVVIFAANLVVCAFFILIQLVGLRKKAAN